MRGEPFSIYQRIEPEERARGAMKEELKEKLEKLPDSPGVYIMKDSSGEVIYIGKASSLKNRVRSYFQPSTLRKPARPIEQFVYQVEDIEYIATRNEVEALMLESNLVKRYQPRFNVRLKDDKRYPFIKVTVSDPFPGIYVTRETAEEGVKLFGPFVNTAVARQIIKELTRIFPIRTCDKRLKLEGNRMKPCLNYHIRRCSAPCAGRISKGEYDELVKSACLLLSSGKENLIRELEREMRRAAEELNFERAAKLRDRIEAVKEMADHQSIISPSAGDEDVIGIAAEGDEACVQVLMVRDGRLVEREHFLLRGARGASLGEMISAFLRQYYADNPYIPGKIVLQERVEEQELLERLLEEWRNGKVSLISPSRGRSAKLVEIARKNAQLFLREMRERTGGSAAENPALLRLRSILNLPSIPRRINAFDISNIGPEYAVGAMVVFEDGQPSKSWYRRFKIKTVEGQDDFSMMREVVYRHFSHVREGEEPRPDLILIDGGKGQLKAALSALQELGFDIPIISLAKGEETIYTPGSTDPLKLDSSDIALRFLQRIRDEAHRFAVSYHRKLRSKPLSFSMLDRIPGIGPKRKRALMRHFGSIERIKAASIEEIASVKGMNRKIAEEVRKFLDSL